MDKPQPQLDRLNTRPGLQTNLVLDDRPGFDSIRIMETKNVLGALAALSQEHRLAVFRLLVEHAPEGLAAGAIAERLLLAPATLSFHLKELATQGLSTPVRTAGSSGIAPTCTR